MEETSVPKLFVIIAAILVLVVVAGSVFVVAHYNSAKSEAQKAQELAKQNRKFAHDQCLDLRQRQSESNTQLREPLDEWSVKSAKAWSVIRELIVDSFPPEGKRTPKEQVFLEALREVEDAAGSLAEKIKPVTLIDCGV